MSFLGNLGGGGVNPFLLALLTLPQQQQQQQKLNTLGKDWLDMVHALLRVDLHNSSSNMSSWADQSGKVNADDPWWLLCSKY